MPDIFLLIGQFHPLLIHLPIGILFSGVALFWYDQISRTKKFQSGIEFLIICSIFFSILSVITGLVLSTLNQYDEALIKKHQYSGIILTILIAAFFISIKIESISNVIKRILSISSIIFLIVTGHYGGTLTHGALNLHVKEKIVKQEYLFNDTSTIFHSIVQPVLNEKCTSCHGSEKQKGDLRLDTYENIVKGGKNGHTVDMYDKNELIHRLILSIDDKKHMPPKERTQLTQEEIKILHWWILHGALKDISLKEFQKNDTLISFIKSKNSDNQTTTNIPYADQAIINKLKVLNVVVYPIELKSPYLYVNLQNAVIDSQIIANLSKLQSNILELKVIRKKLHNNILQVISKMDNLEKLDLSHSIFEDNTTEQLTFPKKLKISNLSNSTLSENHLRSIESLSGLEKLFVYNIKTDSTTLKNLRGSNLLEIYYGNEIVPTFTADTTIVK